MTKATHQLPCRAKLPHSVTVLVCRFTTAFQHDHFCVSQVISAVTGSYSDHTLSQVSGKNAFARLQEL